MKFRLATVALGPLLLLQGRYAKRTTPTLPEPPGARQGAAGSGRPLRLLILGDSAAAGVGASAQSESLSGQLVSSLSARFHVTWQLIAHTGDTAGDVLARLHALDAEHFDVTLTSIGVNDVTGLTRSATWANQHRHLIDVLTTKFSVGHIVLSRLPPMHHFPALPQPLRWYLGLRARQLNAVLDHVAQSDSRCELLVVDLPVEAHYIASDGFHPAAPAYALWAQVAAEAITRRALLQSRLNPAKKLR